MKVYAAIFPNGKKYIGVTSREIEDRISDHKTAMSRVDNKFYRALNKYGIENVEFREIKECQTKEEMFLVEQVLIDKHKTNINGYNTTKGGEGCLGRIRSEEELQKISEAQKKRFQDQSEREKIAEGMRRWNQQNPEKYAQIKKKQAEVLRTEEMRKQASEKQKKYTQENPEHIKEINKKRSERYENDPELRRRISSSLGGQAVEVYRNGEKIHEFVSMNECCNKLDLNSGNARGVLKGKRNHVKGYVIKHKEDKNG